MARTGSAAASAVALFFSCLPIVWGADPAAGAQKAQACFACHGPAGNSAIPANPSLAQQPAQFVSTALFFFREGNRQDPQMSPMAKDLSNRDMNDLAAYFSAQKAAPPRHRSAPESAQAGPQLADKYHCTQCHGPRLLGQQHIPRIAGQGYEYVKKQLLGFKAGTRADIDGNMTSAARAVPEAELAVLADYVAGLDPNAGN